VAQALPTRVAVCPRDDVGDETLERLADVRRRGGVGVVEPALEPGEVGEAGEQRRRADEAGALEQISAGEVGLRYALDACIGSRAWGTA
jgi:hypothetical protein